MTYQRNETPEPLSTDLGEQRMRTPRELGLAPTPHVSGKVCDFPDNDDLECQLHWAEHHASGFSGMAEHNRRHFNAEAARLRAAISKNHGSNTP